MRKLSRIGVSTSGPTRSKEKLSAGFTLIELLTFIVLIGLLSAVSLGGLMKSRTDERDAKRIVEFNDVAGALLQYKRDYESFPDSLTSLIDKAYLQDLPKDPVSEKPFPYDVSLQGAHLGATLETRHKALFADSDVDSPLVLGGDTSGCQGEVGRFCLDLLFPL